MKNLFKLFIKTTSNEVVALPIHEFEANYEAAPTVVKAEFRGDHFSHVTHSYRVWVTLSNGIEKELCTINKMRSHLYFNPTNEVDLVGRTMDRVNEILHLN